MFCPILIGSVQLYTMYMHAEMHQIAIAESIILELSISFLENGLEQNNDSRKICKDSS